MKKIARINKIILVLVVCTTCSLSVQGKDDVPKNTVNSQSVPVGKDKTKIEIDEPNKNFSVGVTSADTANNKNCAAAKDSAKARIARKELSFYSLSRSTPRVMYFYKIDNKHYERTVLKKMKQDTTTQFMACYNKAYQLVLDSVFQCDFFRKVDSITAAYDEKGMGYRASEFRGGQDSLDLWLNKNIKLPAGASPDDSDTFIRVYYFAQIDAKGNITNMKFAKTNCKICEPVVTEALKKLPPFMPATQAGVPTPSTFILPYSRKMK